MFGDSIHIAQRAGGGAHVPRRRSSEIPRYTAAGARALPRPNLLGLTRAAEDIGPYKRPPKILPFPVGRGPCLPTVVPADSRPLSRPTAGALPRNRLASSATGGASAISPPFRVLIASLSCHSEEAAGPTWARHQPSGLPNARSACVRLQSVSPPQRPAGGSGPYLALLRGEPRGGGSAHRRASRGTFSKSPRFIRHRRRFGDLPSHTDS